MNFQSINDIKELMERHGFSFAKKFGQNFLINGDIPKRIASCALPASLSDDEKTACLEIGPGIGTLTNELAMLFDKVVSVEIDDRLIPVLSETLKAHSNIEIINMDILKVDLIKLFKEKFSGYKVSIAANLPYYITSPIIMRLLESGIDFESLTVMVQKEVALRLAAPPSSPDYGALTASCAYYGKIKRLFDVGPGNFIPRPNVTSAVIRLDMYHEKPVTPIDEKNFFRVIKGAFSQRRKTLLNSLINEFPEIGKDNMSALLKNAGVVPERRGETLSVSEFAAISDAFTSFRI